MKMSLFLYSFYISKDSGQNLVSGEIQENCDLGRKQGEGNEKQERPGKIGRVGKLSIFMELFRSNHSRDAHKSFVAATS